MSVQFDEISYKTKIIMILFSFEFDVTKSKRELNGYIHDSSLINDECEFKWRINENTNNGTWDHRNNTKIGAEQSSLHETFIEDSHWEFFPLNVQQNKRHGIKFDISNFQIEFGLKMMSTISENYIVYNFDLGISQIIEKT